MYSLYSVLLIALDVVKGPYLHCHAPLNPFEPPARELQLSTHSHHPRRSSTPTNSSEEEGKEKNNTSTHINGDTRHGCSSVADGPPCTVGFVDRLGGFSDVFVPRSELCRRVMYLIEAESGLLYLFYPEEIAGQHYQRKTLRYTLCFVFRVDAGIVTPSASLTERLIQPYSVLLTGIMDELRKTELSYGYISMGLVRTSSSSWQVSSSLMPRSEKPETSTGYNLDPQQQQQSPSSRLDGFAVDTESGVVSACPTHVFSPSLTSEDLVHTTLKGTSRVNVFLTPLQDPTSLQWTPLEEMITSLYLSLCSEVQQETSGMLLGVPKVMEGQGWKEQQQKQKQKQQQISSSSFLPVKECTLSLRPSHIDSYPVRRQMPQPSLLRHHALEEVPIPIVDYSAEMLEWTDVVIQDVFKAVDGHRTIANIVQIIATGYYDEPVEEVSSQRHLRVLSPLTSPPTIIMSPFQTAFGIQSSIMRSPAGAGGGGASNSGACSQNSNVLQSSPMGALSSLHACDTRILSPLSPSSRSGFALPAALSKGHVAPSLLSRPQQHERTVDEITLRGHEGLQSWWAEMEMTVLEALQHLEVYNYVRIVRPCQLHSTYNTTKAFYQVVSNRQHAARRILGQHMLRVEERFYNLRKMWLLAAPQHEKQQVPLRRQQWSRSGGTSRRPGDSSTEKYSLTLPTVLMAKAAQDWQDKKKNVEGDAAILDPMAYPKSTPHPASSAGLASESNEVITELAKDLEDNKPCGAFVYNELDIDLAAAAALCALGKLTGNTLANVQYEMRRIPGWSNAFAGWEDMCCKALVEMGLLNDWLVETRGPFSPS